jgi:hypothetical protein
MRRLAFFGATLVALLAVSAAVGATPTDRAANPAEHAAFDAAVHAYWCSYLPRDLQPCSQWKLKESVHRISTKSPTWGLSQFTADGPPPKNAAKPEVGVFQNVFLRLKAGKWSVVGAFQSLVYNNCPEAAAGTHVPLAVLEDFGLCERLARDFG